MKHFNKIPAVAAALKQGQVGLFPCDTVWGLIGLISEPIIARLFEIKNRDKKTAMLVLVANWDQVNACANTLAPWQITELKKNWPGATTYILPKNKNIPGTLTGGRETIGIRMPEFQPLKALFEIINQPLISTSANLSGAKPITRPEELDPKLKTELDFIYDKAVPLQGTPSKIIDATTPKLTIIR